MTDLQQECTTNISEANMNEREWLTTSEAAKYAKISEKTLTRAARLGKIKPGSDGRRYRFTTEMVDAFLLGASR